jgi:hypothetical protein
MESLGFSDASSTWSDNPIVVPFVEPRGRHVAPPPPPDLLADWQPEEIGGRLMGSNVRWGLISALFVLVAGLAATAIWAYERPAALAAASAEAVTAEATALAAALPTLESFNIDLLVGDQPLVSSDLFAVEGAARSLFQVSGDIAADESGIRSAATTAASAALDGVRALSDAQAYQVAIVPILVAPGLETDPTLIELDDAARSFGDWQLQFDGVRTALPEDSMPTVTEQLDIVSGDLAATLTSYLDALRTDDRTAAAGVVTELGLRLDDVGSALTAALEDAQREVAERIGETRQALDLLIGS